VKYGLLLATTLAATVGAPMAWASKKKTVYLFDATYLHKPEISDEHYWEEMHFIASIQGVVNRNSPRLYVYFVGGNTGKFDRQWLDYMRNDDDWLRNAEVIELRDLDQLVTTFRDDIKGVVLYDPAVAATSNVASTISGVESLACVRYNPRGGSIYNRMVTDPGGPGLPVVRSLLNSDHKSLFTGRGIIPGTRTPSTGSAKCDAYIWAKERYLDTGKCDPAKIGYYIDSYWITRGGDRSLATLTNHDYFVSNRAFFCDLTCWEDETPNDDPGQPLGADQRTLCAILRSAYDLTAGKRMIHFGGFTPWAFKYTSDGDKTQKRSGVPTEWRLSEIVSCYNAYVDADAIGLSGMANASFFRHYPLKRKYKQELPTIDDLKAKGYLDSSGKVINKKFITIYVGDYDSTAWLYQTLWDNWQDPARGTIPLGWAFNPNLADRFPVGMAMAREKKSELDFFVAGDSGAGYINPGYLLEPRPHSGLPSGLDTWAAHCREYYDRWDLGITGFIIDGYARGIGEAGKDAYAKFSQRGIVAQKIEPQGVHKGMPFIRMNYDLNGPVEECAQTVLRRVDEADGNFLIFRTILRSPSWHKELFDLVKGSAGGGDIEVVDPYTFFTLIKLSSKPLVS
jgi:hypothetical protein